MDRKLTGLLLAGVTAMSLFAGCGSEKKAAPAAQEKAPAAAQAKGPLTLEYTYNRKDGKATNQMAAWIEDGNGKVVRTLFATKYVATKGYKKQNQALPQWVKKSGVAQLDKAKVDAFTQATPQSGQVKVAWDGKDDSGKDAPDGTYTGAGSHPVPGQRCRLHRHLPERREGTDCRNERKTYQRTGPGRQQGHGHQRKGRVSAVESQCRILEPGAVVFAAAPVFICNRGDFQWVKIGKAPCFAHWS